MMNKDKTFEVEANFLKNMRLQVGGGSGDLIDELEIESSDEANMLGQNIDKDQINERKELKCILDEFNYSTSVPVKKLSTNLFDLKNVLQVSSFILLAVYLIISESIYIL